MKRFLAIGLAVAASGAGAAEPLRLRAVETEGATRIEAPLGQAGFSVERAGPREVDLVVEGAGLRFDLSEFASGPASRRAVAARIVAEQGATRIRFVLGCDCDFAARAAGGTVTLEFRETGSAPAAAAAVDEASEEAPLPEAAVALLARNEGRRAPRAAPAPLRRSGEAAPAPAAGPAVEDGGSREEEVRLARQRLLEQLSRAAEQGLLDFASPEAAASVPPPPPEPARAAPKPEPEAPDAVAAAEPEPGPEPEARVPAPPDAPAPVELPVRARTAVDKAFRPDRADTVLASAACLEPARLDAGAWPDAGAFRTEHARLSAALYDEFDNPVPAAATDLARLWIGAGFGSEARALIGLHPDAVEDAPLLADLAAIVEGRTPATDGPLAAAGPCSGLAALWWRAAGLAPAPASAETAERDAEIGTALAEAFERLPLPLRVLLGPRLIVEFVNRGDISAAERIDLLLRRLPGDHGPAHDLARARLLEAAGEGEEAEALYDRLARREIPEAQEALIRLFESRAARGAAVTVDLAEALGLAATLARGDPMERRLKGAEIRARARAEGLAAALEAAREAADRRPRDAALIRDAAHAALEEASAETEGALAYVRAVLAHADAIGPEMSGDAARRRIAAELTGLGLANAALAILEPARARGAPATRRAAAAALVALDDPAAAVAELDGLADPDSLRLRAVAEARRGRPEAALAALEAAGAAAPEEIARLALRAGDWAGATGAGATERRLLAAFMAGEGAAGARAALDAAAPEAAAAVLDRPAEAPEATLGATRQEMEASRAVREVIEGALTDG